MKTFLRVLLCILQLVCGWFPAVEKTFSYQEMQEYLISLAGASEKGCSGGNQVKEFELVLNSLIQTGMLELLAHHPLSQGVRSNSEHPPVFLDETYLYFTSPAFELVSQQMQLSPNACAVRKALSAADLLKPSGDLQVKASLYDVTYNGKCQVTAVRRTVLSDESLRMQQGGIFNYHCCSDEDKTRIPVGINEQGKTVYISPNHPDLKNQHLQVIGDSGSGKSTAANLIALEKYERGGNLIYVDYSNSNSREKMISHGFEEQVYDAHVKEVMLTEDMDRDTLLLHLWAMRDERSIPVFRFTRYGSHVENFLLQLYDLLVEDDDLTATIVIDEIHELDYEKGSALCHIMEKGRGNGIALISILQAPHELKSAQLSRLNQSSVKLIFGLNDRSDADTCLKKMSLKPLSRFSETISDLRKRECLLVGELEDADGELRPKRYTLITISTITN